MLSKFENVVLAAYLFIISYDHASYFIIQGDVSLQRALLVLYRLNMLPVLLAYVMNTSYQFYFFPGIATFGFSLYGPPLESCQRPILSIIWSWSRCWSRAWWFMLPWSLLALLEYLLKSLNYLATAATLSHGLLKDQMISGQSIWVSLWLYTLITVLFKAGTLCLWSFSTYCLCLVYSLSGCSCCWFMGTRIEARWSRPNTTTSSTCYRWLIHFPA